MDHQLNYFKNSNRRGTVIDVNNISFKQEEEKEETILDKILRDKHLSMIGNGHISMQVE